VILLSVLGLIVEYNPLHNGHLYHFNTSLDITQAEYSICVTSGNFVQRGEPAVVDKWSRTLMALHAGIDLVIEIPVIFCVQSAESFSYGAISILNSLGVVDTLCFGSEIGEIDFLKKIAYIISNEPEEYREHIRQGIDSGLSFAVSRSKAVIKYLKGDLDSEQLSEIEHMLQSSNNILGLEYIKWLIRLNSQITPVTIKRMYSNYNDLSIDTPFASATAIRSNIRENIDSITNIVPYYTLDILKKQFSLGKGPVYLEDYSQALLCMLRKMSLEEISKVMDVNEGLEHRIKKASLISGDITKLISNIKSKRYAETRIRRILVHLLLGMQKNDFSLAKHAGGPQYIRVLGFSEKGKKLLSTIKQRCSLPIITNVGDYKKYNNPILKEMIELDIRATDIYAACYQNSCFRTGGYDFYNKPVTL
jgi:predicted nucleotidyltransferase